MAYYAGFMQQQYGPIHMVLLFLPSQAYYHLHELLPHSLFHSGGRRYCFHRGSAVTIDGDGCEDRQTAEEGIPEESEGVDGGDGFTAGEGTNGDGEACEDQDGEDDKA